jgi:Fe-Mn family superoxide dismutase
MMVGAINRAPDAVEAWGRELPATREVVACCIHGREASQGAAAPLRAAGATASENFAVEPQRDRRAPRQARLQTWRTSSSMASSAKRPTLTGKELNMPSEFDRREFFEAAGIAAASVALGAELAPGSANAQTTSDPKGTPMTYELRPLPFDPRHIKGLSEKILTSHYENNYGGAVKRLNAITAQLASLDWATAPTFLVNGLKREELIATNSMVLHEHFFDALGGDGQPIGSLAEAIKRDFGSVERWRAEFSAMGKAEGGGSGWVILAYLPRNKRLINTWAADHTTTLAGGRPVLVLDMYEHAYHMDYGAKAAAYVDAFMQGIRWDTPAQLYERYSGES